MSENNWNDDISEKPKKNPFKEMKFYIAYVITVLTPVAIAITTNMNVWLMMIFIICIPYILVGLVIWAILRKKNRSIALGILFGSITPFIVVFLFTGGCGLFMF
ncbi:MAG: hypothetical protein ACRDA4_03775 [Filifactoraceae bacterium]